MNIWTIFSIIWIMCTFISFFKAVYDNRVWKKNNKEVNSDDQNLNYVSCFLSSLILGPIGVVFLLLEKVGSK
jgi:hypothetical protein